MFFKSTIRLSLTHEALMGTSGNKFVKKPISLCINVLMLTHTQIRGLDLKMLMFPTNFVPTLQKKIKIRAEFQPNRIILTRTSKVSVLRCAKFMKTGDFAYTSIHYLIKLEFLLTKQNILQTS